MITDEANTTEICDETQYYEHKKLSFFEKIKLIKNIDDAKAELIRLYSLEKAEMSKLNSLKIEIEILEKGRDVSKARYDEIKEMLDLAEDIKTLTLEKNNLQNELDSLRQALKEKTGLIRGLVELDDINTKIASLKEELENLLKEKEVLLTIDELEEKKATLQSEIASFIENKNLYICEYAYLNGEYQKDILIGAFQVKLEKGDSFNYFKYLNILDNNRKAIKNSKGESFNSLCINKFTNTYVRATLVIKKEIPLIDVYMAMGKSDLASRKSLSLEEIYQAVNYVGINFEMFGFDKTNLYDKMDEEAKKKILTK